MHHLCDVIVSVVDTLVDRGLKSRSVQIKERMISICFFSTAFISIHHEIVIFKSKVSE